jgi:hypothetical protein
MLFAQPMSPTEFDDPAKVWSVLGEKPADSLAHFDRKARVKILYSRCSKIVLPHFRVSSGSNEFVALLTDNHNICRLFGKFRVRLNFKNVVTMDVGIGPTCAATLALVPAFGPNPLAKCPVTRSDAIRLDYADRLPLRFAIHVVHERVKDCTLSEFF